MKQRISRLYTLDDELDPRKIPAGADFLHISETDYPFYLVESVLEPARCDEIVRKQLARGLGHALTTSDGNLSMKRKTFNLEMSDKEQHLFYEIFDGLKKEIERFYGINIISSEGVGALGYPIGGEYRAHNDNCNPVFSDSGEMTHFDFTMPDRTVSTVLFLTDSVEEIDDENQCIGGNLLFKRFINTEGERLLIEPKKGCLIAFPSNPYYQHQVCPVYEGFRISWVDWHKARFPGKERHN